MDRDWLARSKHEFRTRPRPTAGERDLYVDLVWRSRLPLWKKLEHSASVWRRWYRLRA
ncbi:MAG: hypothetical protein ACREVL_15040 [Solimonas sp.]